MHRPAARVPARPSPRRSVRATSTVVPIPTERLSSTSQPRATHHQTPGTTGTHAAPVVAHEHRVRRQQPGEPAQADEGRERQGEHRLDRLCPAAGSARPRAPRWPRTGSNSSSRRARSPIRGYSYTSATVTVGEPLAQGAHQLGGHEAAAAGREEVVVRTRDRDAERGRPPLRDPSPVASGPRPCGLVVVPSQRPGSASRSTLPEPRVGIDPTGASRGHQRGGQRPDQPVPGVSQVQLHPGLGHQVPDEHRGAGGRAADRGGRTGDPGQAQQRGVDLAQLDPPATDLHLVVGASDEQQPLGLVPHQVRRCGTPAPSPAARPGVLLRVLDRVEVPRQPDAADDQLPEAALLDLRPVGRDDREVPAVQRPPDPHGSVGREQARAPTTVASVGP